MKKYLREIEVSGLILIIIGCVISFFWGDMIGVWPCAAGMLLWLVSFLYKAFHWQEYERENKQNIVIVIIAIVLLLIQMVRLTKGLG